jgi:methanogenic corrinoid protein MtbC1
MPDDLNLSEEELLVRLAESVLALEVEGTAVLAQYALDHDYSARRAILEGLSEGMRQVGQRFCSHDYFVPEVLVAARAMYRGLNLLKPRMLEEGGGLPTAGRGRVAIGVVQGDLHDIGKNIVKLLLEAEGFEVTDLGKNLTTDNLLQELAKESYSIVALSTLMTSTLDSMKTSVEKIRAAHPAVKIMVGGAPVTEAFAHEIKADGTAPDATGAVTLALAFMESR